MGAVPAHHRDPAHPEALGPLILGYTFVVIASSTCPPWPASSAVAGSATSPSCTATSASTGGSPRLPTMLIIGGVQLLQFAGNLLARRVLRRSVGSTGPTRPDASVIPDRTDCRPPGSCWQMLPG